jgi:hypothetical protein
MRQKKNNTKYLLNRIIDKKVSLFQGNIIFCFLFRCKYFIFLSIINKNCNSLIIIINIFHIIFLHYKKIEMFEYNKEDLTK